MLKSSARDGDLAARRAYSSMKQYSMVLAGALVISGAGFFAGRYTSVGTDIGGCPSDYGAMAADPPISTPSAVTLHTGAPSGVSAKTAPPTPQATPVAARARIGEPSNKAVTAFPSRALPTAVLVLTPQEQSDLVAQQLEAKDANLKQLEGMIQSLESGGAPQEQIAHFRELMAAMAEAPIDDSQVAETNPPERGEADLKSDFAASLEQSGIAREQHEQMLEPFSSAPLPIDDYADAHGMEMFSPHGESRSPLD